MKLLIVDDSLVIRNKITRGLAKHFSKIMRVENGSLALKALKQETPDVITMDLTMPEMDGVECIKNIMKINPKVHILVISALADKGTAITALKLGANGFLCKPFDEKALCEAIAKILKIQL